MADTKELLKALTDAKGEVDRLLREAGIDPDKPLSGQGVSHWNGGKIRRYIKDGKIIAELHRMNHSWVVVAPI